MSAQAVERVAGIPLHHHEKLVMLLLANRAGSDDECYPSIQKLSVEAGLSERTIQRMIKRLERLRLIAVTRGDGRGNLTRYRLLKGDNGDGKGDNGDIPKVTERVTTATERVTTATKKGDNGDTIESSKEPREEKVLTPSSAPTPSLTNGALAAFDQFWAIYPRKDDKLDAQKAWSAAIKKAAPDEIIAGARGYPFSADRQYIKLPAGWLRNERWKPPPSGGPQPKGNLPPGYVPGRLSGFD